MVQENNVEEAMRLVNRIVVNEGIHARWKLTRRQVKLSFLSPRNLEQKLYMCEKGYWVTFIAILSSRVMEKKSFSSQFMYVCTYFLSHLCILFRYEKPTWARNRVNIERCRAIYNEDMQNKIRFIMRKNRKDPYPGTN